MAWSYAYGRRATNRSDSNRRGDRTWHLTRNKSEALRERMSPLEGDAQARNTADAVARRSFGKLVAFLAARTRDVAACLPSCFTRKPGGARDATGTANTFRLPSRIRRCGIRE